MCRRIVRYFLKIGRGEDLLLNTFLSVEEIAARVGYANPETFIRAFRRANGVTPSRFRKDRKGD